MAAGSQLSNPGSSSVNPDLDWSQIKETISMICLAMAQIETTLNDSSKSVDDLTSTFTGMSSDARQIANLAENANSEDEWQAAKLSIMSTATQMHQQVQTAIVAFQFYDRLSQKLGHVNTSLNHLGDLINDSARLYNPDEWKIIQDEIRSNYTMECERMMFDHIMKGMTVPEALELYRHQFEITEKQAQSDDSDDDIELF